MSDVHALTELQISLLRVLWERGEGSAQDVHEALAGERDLALTTVATLLARLERRGIVRHRREGRRFIYRACVSEREVRRSKLREITETL
ncbi:MAG: BlaI/MecI/CopY family transcriptional regulator, partial [Gemmatimonadetes bacterium]